MQVKKISLVVAGISWFVLVAEEGERQQEFPSQKSLLNCWLPHIHHFHLTVGLRMGGCYNTTQMVRQLSQEAPFLQKSVQNRETLRAGTD